MQVKKNLVRLQKPHKCGEKCGEVAIIPIAPSIHGSQSSKNLSCQLQTIRASLKSETTALR